MNTHRFVVSESYMIICSVKTALTYTMVDGYQDSGPECWDNVNET